MSAYRLRECRIKYGLTQQQVADALQISSVNYSRYETGVRQMSLEDVIKLAAFYQCSTDELLGSWHYYSATKADDNNA